jgi:hypothetical protein
MSQTSQVRFANDYCRAPRNLRLQIDAWFALYRKLDGALGVVSLVGVGSAGTTSTISFKLGSDFSIDDFSAALKSLRSVESVVLLVSAGDVFLPLASLQLLSKTHAECNIIRISAANMTYEYRTLNWLIEFATAESLRRESTQIRSMTKEERIANLLAGFMGSLVRIQPVGSHENRASS